MENSMKKKKGKYGSKLVCPETRNELSDNSIYYNDGICEECGDISEETICHYKQLSGIWYQPSLFDRVFKGRKAVFEEKQVLPTTK